MRLLARVACCCAGPAPHRRQRQRLSLARVRCLWPCCPAALAARCCCRVVGGHRLLLLNYYPFLQKYAAPSTRDVTAVLAALVGACHELVPPEALAPVLRQLVDGFVHDRCGRGGSGRAHARGTASLSRACVRALMQPGAQRSGDLAQHALVRSVSQPCSSSLAACLAG